MLYIDNIAEEIINKYGITLLVVFGSFAEGTTHKDSDLDLGYMSSNLLTKETELSLLGDLIKYYKRSNIDLVNLKKATPTLKLEVACKGRLIYGTEEDFLRFQLYAAAHYADTKFLRQERENYLKSRMKII
ncbi:MAG: nucleotidyltransferase domain-containing protein [Deferribacterota bacterium]|nr:nucleotidyltransferase domain-containing protein [Deferribacterota bacterium]